MKFAKRRALTEVSQTSIKMIISILTIFPEMVRAVFEYGVIGRAIKKGVLKINPVDLRDFATDKHRSVDDKPFGGGPGMVMRVDVVDRAFRSLGGGGDSGTIFSGDARQRDSNPDAGILKTRSLKVRPIRESNSKSSLGVTGSLFPRKNMPSSPDIFERRTVLLSAKGKLFNQRKAEEYSKLDDLILISGRYEGVDERVREHLVDEEISIGEYVLSGGEIPAMAVADAVARLLPGVVGDPESLVNESFSTVRSQKSEVRGQEFQGRLDFPQYTQPAEYKGWKVPEVLRSGDHGKIRRWREEKSRMRGEG